MERKDTKPATARFYQKFANKRVATDFVRNNGVRVIACNHLSQFSKVVGLWYETEAFECEICHEITPKHCEGAEPNTCAMCMPLIDRTRGVNFDRNE